MARKTTAKKNDFDADITSLKVSEKSGRVIQFFLQIECEASFDRTPQQAKTLRKKIVDEIRMALKHTMFYDEDKKQEIPLWHKILIASQDTETRTKKIRYILRSLARQIRDSDNRRRF